MATTTEKKRGNKSQAIREQLARNPTASASEIVTALGQQGLKVSQAMVYNIRSASQKTKKKKPGRRKRRVASRASANGSRRRGGKSAAIRAAFQTLGANARSKEVIGHLAARGVTVSAAHVANVKSRMPSTSTRRAPAAQPAARAAAGISVEQLMAAKELANRFGGTEELRRALETLDKLLA